MRLRLFAMGASFALFAAACGHDDDAGSGSPSGDASPGDDGGAASVNDITIHPAANDAQFSSPFDATPDPDGKAVYFTAMTADGAAVFRAAAGGGELTRLFAGDPFVSPFAIAISDDGSQLFVADVGAESDTEERGAVFTLPASGGTPSVVAGTAGIAPRGIEISGDTVYVSGSHLGEPAVFTMPLAGNPMPLLHGDLLHDPSGIAVSKAGTVYVLDALGASSGLANVVAIESGTPRVVASDLATGFPGGLALDRDEKTLLISALDGGTGADTVLFLDLASGNATPFTKSIDQFTEAAGLHRARRASVYAWADSMANGGTVFVLQ